MKSANFMSNEMIAQLFEEFKKDQVRWAKFKSWNFPTGRTRKTMMSRYPDEWPF